MKKIRFYITLVLLTIFVGIVFFYFSDYSRRVNVIYSFMKDKDKEKIINNLVEKVEIDSLRENFRSTLQIFAQKIGDDAYSDEHLRDLIKDFGKITEMNKITSIEIDRFSQKVKQDF